MYLESFGEILNYKHEEPQGFQGHCKVMNWIREFRLLPATVLLCGALSDWKKCIHMYTSKGYDAYALCIE